MQKFVVNKGKAGYDFNTLANSEAECLDKAWELRELDKDIESQRWAKGGPFSWWKSQQKKWGHDKWYIVELSINQAVKEAPSEGSDFPRP